MKNKIVATIIILLFTLIIQSCKEKGCNNLLSFNYDENAEKSDGSCLDMGGCLGYQSGYTNSGTLGNTLYNNLYDQKMAGEVSYLRNFFNGIHANVYILYEPSPALKNAYANPNGDIYMGYYMFYYTVNKYGELPVAGILAHEWGHRAQQTIGWNDYYRAEHKELEADAFSGYYLALNHQLSWSSLQAYYNNVYSLGDYAFSSPDHHGTGDQRLAAAYMGLSLGADALNNNHSYTYTELHQIFFGQIENNIAPRQASSNNFKEVVYPKNLTKEYIKSLYPHLN